jgi:hypothetical protein
MAEFECETLSNAKISRNNLHLNLISNFIYIYIYIYIKAHLWSYAMSVLWILNQQDSNSKLSATFKKK